MARKEAGTAIGFVVASRPGDERFLAKMGLPDVRSVLPAMFVSLRAGVYSLVPLVHHLL